jgi:hypothetical protein
MSYKFSTGSVRQGDIYFEDDRTGAQTYIDFGQDTITLRPSGSQILYAQHNRVGIGTTSPMEALHIAGNVKAVGNDARIKIDGETDSHPGLELYENGTRKWIVFNNYTNDNLTFKTNSNTRMSITQAGNVGIGTQNPIVALDVNGGMRIQSDSIAVQNSKTPSSASDTGQAGQICWDTNYLYVCVALNTWKRIALSSW